MSQAREKVNLTLPPDLVERLDTAGRQLSERTGVKLSQSQVMEAAIKRGLPMLESEVQR